MRSSDLFAERPRRWLTGLLATLIPIAGFLVVFHMLDNGPQPQHLASTAIPKRDQREQIIDALKLHAMAFNGRFPSHLYGDQLIAEVWEKLDLYPDSDPSPRAGFSTLNVLSRTDKTFGYYGGNARLGIGNRVIVHWSDEPNQNTVVFSNLSWKIVDDLTLMSTLNPWRLLASSATVRIGDGSGVIVTGDGLLLTANHVVPFNRNELDVKFEDGRTANAKLIERSIRLDVAVMRISDEFVNSFFEISNRKPQQDELVWAIGFADGVRQPIIRQANVNSAVLNELVTDHGRDVRGGDSGGAIINETGELVAVILGPASQNPHRVRGALGIEVLNRWPSLFTYE